MSQEKVEIVTDTPAEFRIDTRAVTRTTTKVHRIRWTIEDVSQMPSDRKITGPDFYLTKTCLCNISFMKNSSHIYVYLHNKSDRAVKIERRLVLLDCDGTALHHEKMGTVYTLEKKIDVDVIGGVSKRNRFESLRDDILIIDCCLKVEGCITTEMGFFKSDRESREHLIKDLKTMFNNPVDSDFVLQVGSEIIHSHKSLLRARSAYFKRMFETEMKESTENSVTITDVSHPTVLKLVEFLYTGDFTETEDNIQKISDLYFAADKYEVMDLRSLCADKLVSTATADNISQILQLAQRHHDKDLKIRAMNFVSSHFKEIIKTDAWKTFICSEHAMASEVLSFCFKKLEFF